MAKKSNNNLWLTFWGGIVLTTLSGWNISPWAKNNFEGLCGNFVYEDCMKFYWQHAPYYTGLAIIGLLVAGISLIIRFKHRN